MSFVLQGPPGTGKSQTITNIIAECISDGKSVLFVSEKMAALDVVKKRLENCGLGDFCLELHSNKASKKLVIESLEKGLLLEQKALKQNVEEELKKLDLLKKQLNNYIKTLHEPKTALGISAYEVQSQLAKLNRTELLIFDIPNILNIDAKNLAQINENLKKLAKLQTVFPDIEKQPWKTIKENTLTIEKETLIRRNIDTLIIKSKDLLISIDEYSRKTNLRKLKNSNEIGKWLTAVEHILTTKKPISNWLKPDYNIEKLKEYTFKVASDFKKYQEIKLKLLEKYNKNILNQNLIYSLKLEYNNLFNFFGKNVTDIHINQEHQISEVLENFKTNYEKLEINLEILTPKLGIVKPETFIELDYLIKLLDYIENEPQLQDIWWDENFLRQLLLKVDDIKVKSDSFLAKLNNFSSKYNKEILSLDILVLLKRFETDYKSFFRGLNPIIKQI